MLPGDAVPSSSGAGREAGSFELCRGVKRGREDQDPSWEGSRRSTGRVCATGRGQPHSRLSVEGLSIALPKAWLMLTCDPKGVFISLNSLF